MVKYIENINKAQTTLFPSSVEDYVTEDNIVRVIYSLSPDFRTISDFRKDNSKALKSVFDEFNTLCIKLDLFSKSLISLDGSKFQAVNSKDNNFTLAKLDDRLNRANKKAKDFANMINEMNKKGESQKSITDPDSLIENPNNIANIQANY